MAETIELQALTDKATELDAHDPLRSFRDEFWIPLDAEGKPEIYLVGNSLGLQPKQAAECVLQDLESWKTRGVRGHFEGAHPWLPYHEFLTESMARIVGGLPEEVVVMNSLTTNLHLMMASFYRPQGNRRKILVEDHAFPSDHYAVESQIRWHSLSPSRELIVLRPDSGEELISTEKILRAIDYYQDSLALVLLPGVQYYTGQVFDIGAITQAAHQYDILVGFDLAHAAGNVRLKLHEWDVDFAVWCSYKYLNCGPGSVAGCFVHQRFATDSQRFRLAGWWGHDKATRFQMDNTFRPIPTVEGWQLSNPPILALSTMRASLAVFDRAGMTALAKKSNMLTGFLGECLEQILPDCVQIVTPREPEQRGCQLSLKINTRRQSGKAIHQQLDKHSIRTDWREPNVIRAAPVPLYNTFDDALRFVLQLRKLIK